MYKKLLPAVFVLSLLLLGIGMTAFGQEAHEAAFVAQEDVSLTIARRGGALVRDVQRFDFVEGLNRIEISGFDHNVELGTLSVSSPDNNGIYAVRQSLETVTLNRNQLIEQSIGQEITLIGREGNEIAGILVHRQGDELLMQTSENEYLTVFLNDFRQVRYPDSLQIETPRIVLHLWIYSPQAGEQSIALTYVRYGLAWNIEYNLLLADDDNSVQLSSWLNIDNFTPINFEDADITLISGNANELQLVSAQRDVVPTIAMSSVAATATALSSTFESTRSPQTLPSTGGGGGCCGYYDDSQIYQEYHLPQKMTLVANEQTRIEYLAETTIEAENRFVYDASPRVYGYSGFITNPTYGISNIVTVQNFLEITVDVDLPSGAIRVYRESDSGAMRQVGQSRISYTPANDHLQIFLTQSDEVTGERRQLDFQQLSQDAVQESYELRLRNNSDEAVTIVVPERMSRSANWEILLSNMPYEQPNEFGIVYEVEVAAGEITTINYTVLYTRP